MKHGNRYDRHRLCAFAGFDGKTYDALCVTRRNGMTRADYFVTLNDGTSRLVTAYLDRREAKARLTQRGASDVPFLLALAVAVIIGMALAGILRGIA